MIGPAQLGLEKPSIYPARTPALCGRNASDLHAALLDTLFIPNRCCKTDVQSRFYDGDTYIYICVDFIMPLLRLATRQDMLRDASTVHEARHFGCFTFPSTVGVSATSAADILLPRHCCVSLRPVTAHGIQRRPRAGGPLHLNGTHLSCLPAVSTAVCRVSRVVLARLSYEMAGEWVHAHSRGSLGLGLGRRVKAFSVHAIQSARGTGMPAPYPSAGLPPPM